MSRESILDDTHALGLVEAAGYGLLILSPAHGATHDDAKIERMVIRMAEHLRDFGVDEEATYPELLCAAIEFAARVSAASLALGAAPRSEQRKLADVMAKNLRSRMLGALRHEGSGQERTEN
jgi:hypothetical protein